MILGDAWGAIGGIGSVFAAVAALVTVFYARKTVSESITSRRENRQAHEEEMREERDALEVATTAHHEEMLERRSALESSISLQRLVQLERVSETLQTLVDVIQDEMLRPRPLVEGTTFKMTMVPTVLGRLRASVTILDALAMEPRLDATDRLAKQAPVAGQAYGLVTQAVGALDEIDRLVQNVPGLRLDKPKP